MVEGTEDVDAVEEVDKAEGLVEEVNGAIIWEEELEETADVDDVVEASANKWTVSAAFVQARYE